MAITEVPPVTGPRTTAGIIRRLILVVCTWRRKGVPDPDPDAWLKKLRIVTVPDPGPETWYESFFPEDWSGSTVN